ncbi:allophanate hydrolase subunit 1 [Nocardia sp. 348MFTsu5.1]|uniref:5-oxoprolinase subunit B family protein n=1 Tax=Nocardia sp. 348MFTsu5.1 TaxID=1172185 RepID=UPI000378518D|nr:allophanate hydrolase subunit 1 [Nocardia sp. 348MFTsu5.1]
MKVLAYGDRSLMVEVDTIEEVIAWTSELGDAELPGVLDIIPGARTVLLVADGPEHLPRLRKTIGALSPDKTATASDGDPDLVEVPVIYDGADLDDVGRLTGLSTGEVVAAHTGAPWMVAFGGFAPGFAYLVGGDDRLEVPRRDESRTRVPAGAVGLAGEFSGIYPRTSPGGWQLLGHTDLVMWDATRDPPALLRPGCLVQFRDAGRSSGRSANG